MNSNQESFDLQEVDEHIDAALDYLRSAEPLPGMRARLLRGAREAQVKKSLFLRPAVWQFAAVAACTVLAIAGVTISKHKVAEPNYEATHVVPLGSLERPATVARSSQRPQRAVPHIIPDTFGQQRLTLASASRTHRSSTEDHKPKGENSAYAEMIAPSKPAPALPLTDQERLLLAVAHREDRSSQVAELKRPVWPLHDPDQDDNFEQFFQRPPAPPQHGDSE